MTGGDGGAAGPHYHTLVLSTSDLKELKAKGQAMTLVTSTAAGHDHEIVIRYHRKPTFAGRNNFEYCKFRYRFGYRYSEADIAIQNGYSFCNECFLFLVQVHKCDGKWGKCWDGHYGWLALEDADNLTRFPQLL